MLPPSASFCSYRWIQVSIFPFSILFFPTHKRKEERKKRTDDQRCCQKKENPDSEESRFRFRTWEKTGPLQRKKMDAEICVAPLTKFRVLLSQMKFQHALLNKVGFFARWQHRRRLSPFLFSPSPVVRHNDPMAHILSRRNFWGAHHHQKGDNVISHARQKKGWTKRTVARLRTMEKEEEAFLFFHMPPSSLTNDGPLIMVHRETLFPLDPPRVTFLSNTAAAAASYFFSVLELKSSKSTQLTTWQYGTVARRKEPKTAP